MEEVHLIRPSSQVNRPVERLGDFSYRLEVTSFDSPIQAVMGGVSDPNDPPDRELQALVSSGGGKESIIRKGQQRILEGVIRNAYPIWIIFNLDDRKSARVRVRLTLRER